MIHLEIYWNLEVVILFKQQEEKSMKKMGNYFRMEKVYVLRKREMGREREL